MTTHDDPHTEARENLQDRPTERELLQRITFEPGKMGGRACIRNMRITAGLIVALISQGATHEEILDDFPYLEEDDIRAALVFAAWLAREQVYPAS